MIAHWLLAALVKIVTTYTQPGGRVLLLAPPRSTGRPRWWSLTPVRTTSPDEPYTGLFEAVWTLTRLGRTVRTYTASPPLDQHGYTHLAASEQSESGRRPATRPAGTDASGLGPTRSQIGRASCRERV